MAIPKVKFIIDEQYDLEMVYWILKNNPANLDWLTKNIKINLDLIRKIQKEEKKEGTESLKGPASVRYQILLPYIKKTLKFYQISWNEINEEFFKTVQKITDYPWKHKAYFCVLSPFHRGISSWGGNKIIRSWQENPYTMRKTTAHELLISHIFTIFEGDFKETNLTGKEKWALAEISAWAITGLEEKMLKFWPWISEEEKYPLSHNYPELYGLQEVLKTEYEKKKNFREFLNKAINIIKTNNPV